MIAAILLEFFLLVALDEYNKQRYVKTLVQLTDGFKIVWYIQLTATVTYLAWKYLPWNITFN